MAREKEEKVVRIIEKIKKVNVKVLKVESRNNLVTSWYNRI